MSIKIENILRDYIDAAIAHGKATETGDYKTANKQYGRLKNIYKKLEKDRLISEIILKALFQQESISVKIWASAHALGLNIRIDDAINILEHYSREQSIGILRLNAEMTLKEWQRKNNLKFD